MCIFIQSCSKKVNELPKPVDFSYYPMKAGKGIVYFVEQIHIDDPVNVRDTQRYYLMELIESSYLDETGNTVYRIERFKRSDSLSNWELTDVWMSQYVQNQAHKVEENIRYVKLLFPAKKRLSWDGNAYNTLDKQLYTVEEVDTPWNIFDSTCLIFQQNNESLVDKYYQSERYAKNVGLVEKIDIRITQAYIIAGIPIEQRIKRGDVYRQTILSHF